MAARKIWSPKVPSPPNPVRRSAQAHRQRNLTQKLVGYRQTHVSIVQLQKEDWQTMQIEVQPQRFRWYNHLDPEISKKAWTKPEEEKLLSLHKIYGNKWTVIAEEMTGRYID